MKKLTITLITIILFTFILNNSYGQCEGCPEVSQKTDFCYKNEDIAPERCAFFIKDSSFFFFTKKKKVLKLNLPKKETPEDYKIFTDKKLKLKAEDILFLWKAISVWRKEELRIGFEFTESGLGYRVKVQGKGPYPKEGDRVQVHYRGYLEDGTEFDNSYKRGKPFTFVIGKGQVIKGWDEGIKLFREGSKGTLLIPSNLGYGARGVPGVIPPNATLFFDIEIVKINPKQ